jgi:hypothetical protein
VAELGSEPESDRPGPPAQLVREWALCGIAMAAARFLPVPLLDDAVRERATRLAVLRTLRVQGRAYPSDAVEPLYAGVDGRSGVWQAARRLPSRVLLFPVRKYVALFGSVRGVPADVTAVLLLGRSVYRALAAGRMQDGHRHRQGLRAEAEQVRRAYDSAIGGMDLRLATGVVRDALAQGQPMTRAAVDLGRRFLRHEPVPDELHPGDPVVDGAIRVQQALRRPELRRLIADFDARFDARLSSRRSASGR